MTGTALLATMSVRLDRRRNSIPVVDPATGLIWIVGKYGVAVRYGHDPMLPGWARSEFADRDVLTRLRDVYPGRWPSDRKSRTMTEVREIINALGVREISGKVQPV